MRNVSMVLVLGFAILSLGADDKEKDKDKDLEKFQGVWKASKATTNGMEVPMETLKGFDMTIKENKAVPASDPKDVAKIKLDSSKKPAEIDFVDKDNKVDRGIYRFVDADTLEICAEIEGGERPKDFDAPKDTKRFLLVLKRSK